MLLSYSTGGGSSARQSHTNSSPLLCQLHSLRRHRTDTCHLSFGLDVTVSTFLFLLFGRAECPGRVGMEAAMCPKDASVKWDLAKFHHSEIRKRESDLGCVLYDHRALRCMVHVKVKSFIFSQTSFRDAAHCPALPLPTVFLISSNVTFQTVTRKQHLYSP